MARPYSLDLRERVASAVSCGESCRSVSRTFGVSVASVVRWSQRARETGSAAAYAMGGRRRWLLEAERDWLLARIPSAASLRISFSSVRFDTARRSRVFSRSNSFRRFA